MGTWGYTVYKKKNLLYLIVIAYWTVNLPSLWLGPIDLHIPQIPNSTHLRQSYMVGIPQSHIFVLVQRSFLKIVQFSAGKKKQQKNTHSKPQAFLLGTISTRGLLGTNPYPIKSHFWRWCSFSPRWDTFVPWRVNRKDLKLVLFKI